MNRKTKLVISSKDDSPSRVNKNARVVPGNDGSDDPDFNDTEFQDIENQLQELKFDNMEKEDLLMEIQKVDREYLRINMRLSGLAKNRRHVFRGDQDALNLQLRTLKQRSDMLFKCLDKVLPDKRQTAVDLTLNSTEVDQIPTAILQKIALGTITQEEYEHYEHLFEKDKAQKGEDEKVIEGEVIRH